MLLFAYFVLVCFGLFWYDGSDLVYLCRFTGDWVFEIKYFDVVVCFCMLSSMLNIVTNHLCVNFSKSILLYCLCCFAKKLVMA